ncbi:hypothetical protein [Ekhidna sp.]|uniref:hypothetical protein n=1 Tax=Ekhidna sp. TaxID=2608089 RepID=UPI003B5118DC
MKTRYYEIETTYLIDANLYDVVMKISYRRTDQNSRSEIDAEGIQKLQTIKHRRYFQKEVLR